MRNLAIALAEYLAGAVRERVTAQQNGRLQLVYVGPPLSVLEELFDLLTSDGTAEWNIEGLDDPVAVLLVGSKRPSQTDGVSSARATWDYAVTMRHSGRHTLVLVTPGAWQGQPESIENASDRLGVPATRSAAEFVRTQDWLFLLRRVESTHGYPARQVARCIRDVWRDSVGLTQVDREELPWRAADDLLSGNGLVESVGLPSLTPGAPLNVAIRRAREALSSLASICAHEGFNETEQKFEQARQEIRERERRDGEESGFLPDDITIELLFSYLRRTAGSGGAFLRSPSLFFRREPNAPDWWNSLTDEVLSTLLNATDTPRPPGKLVLQVASLIQPARDEPCVVVDEMHLEVLSRVRRETQSVPTMSVFRRAREGNREWIDVEDNRLTDDDLPNHSRAITYKVAVPEHVDATVRVIALNRFDCLGHAHVNGALRNPAPMRRARGQAPFEQTILIRQSGIHRVTILVADGIISVSMIEPEAERLQSPVHNNQAEFTLYIEQDTQKTIVLTDQDGGIVHSWELGFEVEEITQGVVHSQFEDLVLSHQEGVRTRVVTAVPCQARELEASALESEYGYRALIACWLPDGPSAGRVDWDTCRVGDVRVPDDIDPRPPVAKGEPPAAFLEARRQVVAYLQGHPERYIAEVPLSGDEPAQLASMYLSAYNDWLRESPEAAVWIDCIAVHTYNSQGVLGPQTVSDEPIVLLLTPLHPLRFAWHANAQGLLKEGLDNECPLAGLLSPHHTPSITALPIWFGRQVEWRPFIGVPCEDKHWAVLANGAFLRTPQLEQAFAVLRRLGLGPQGVTGGISTSQANRALDDVSGILCAKPVLRVGLVGNPQESAGSTDAVLRWVQHGFRVFEPATGEGVEAEEAETATTLPTANNPVSVEVFDFRGESALPSEAMLANLSEDIDSRIRWFDGRKSTALPALDMAIFDQVGTTMERLQEPAWVGPTRSVLGSGALFRVHIREDQNDGRLIAEARVGRQRHSGQGLAALLNATIQMFEELAQHGHATHLEFSPNKQEFDGWIQNARFLAATSSQIDPACFIRGSGERGAYLWDYDLPGAAGIDSSAAGYYLIARPRDSLKDAVTRSLATIVDALPPADPILTEISRRGIPVLKRLASVGTRSKGEVGVLLAVRLLQDAFREESTGVRLPIVHDDCIHMLLAVDSYQSPFSMTRRALVNSQPMKRPDLLVFAIHLNRGTVRIRITPLEVKFHTTPQHRTLTDAVEQADSMAQLLKLLWVDPPLNPVWDAAGRALLARGLDQCFRVYADPRLHQMDPKAWAEMHEEVLEEVLGSPQLGDIVSINRGRLMAFGPAFPTSRLVSMDGDGIQESLLIDSVDARFLLSGEGTLSAVASEGVEALGFSFPDCRHVDMTQPTDMPMEEIVDGTEHVEPENEQPPTDEDVRSPLELRGEAAAVHPGDEEDDSEHPEEETEDTDTTPQSGGTIPLEIRAQVRDAFAGFIGNEMPVRRITKDLLVALTSEPPGLPRNYILSGSPSVGKTELARRIARAIRLPFVKLDGTGLTAREKLFELVDQQLGEDEQPVLVGQDAGQPVLRYPSFVVFVDEVHLVPRKVQESLLTILEAKDREVRLRDRVVQVPQATFIFATTQDSRLDRAFKSRCIEIQLSSYSIAQVAEMATQFVREAGVDPGTWDPEVFPKIARLGRRIPRRAFEVAKDLIDELRTTEHPELPLVQHLKIVQEMMQVDANGLGPLDIEYLEALDRHNRPLGEDNIVSMLGTVDEDKILEEVEPLLRRLNLITLGPRGREITSEGREYVATRRANPQ